MRPPRSPVACAAAAVLVALGALACTPQPDDEARDAGPGAPACAAPFVGALTLDGVEGEPGYDDALAALDLEALPSTLPLASLSELERGLVLYMLDARELDAVDRDDALEEGGLGRAVLGAYAAAAPPEVLDFAFLRRGLFRFYGCERGFPPTLDDFLSDVFDFRAELAEAEIVDSEVKGLRRRISRSAGAGAFVAETLRDDDSVRETEVILTDRRADLGLEFFEYDEDGRLRAASEFAAAGGGESVGAMPFSCIACHGFRNVVPGP